MSLVSKNYSDYFAILLDLIHDKPQRKYLMLTNVKELNVLSNVQPQHRETITASLLVLVLSKFWAKAQNLKLFSSQMWQREVKI